MQLSVLLLSALLALCSASVQDVNSPPEEGPSLDPDLEDALPEVPLNGSASTPQKPVHIQRNRLSKSPPPRTSLTWMFTRGGVPSGAVFSGSAYVCQYRCSAGFFNPRMGPHCHYPFAGKEQRGTPFQILVKRNRSEVLSWKTGSQGAVPKNSVQTCRGVGIYVGRNGMGLGSVIGQKGFSVARNGRAYWFRSYQALTYT